MSHFLVTGGTGCIGSHLVELLTKENHQVTVIDNLIYPQQSPRVLQELKISCPKTCFYHFDLSNQALVSDFLINHSFDGIIHLAALPSHRISLAYPYEFFQSDLVATLNILENIRKFTPRTKLLFVSTNKIYSDTETLVTESSPVNPIGPYALSKYQSEQWCSFYVKRFGLKIATTRLFHVVGTRMQPNREIPVFTKSILEGSPITLHGKYDQYGNFESAYFGYTSVDDTVTGIYTVLKNIDNLQSYEAYNIGNSKKTSVRDILSHISQLLNITPVVQEVSLHEHETIGCLADTTKLQSLGWSIQHDPLESVSKYLSWVRSL